MTQSSNVEVSSFANIVDVAIEGQSFVKCNSEALDCFRNSNWSVAKSHRIDSTLPLIPGTGTDYDDLWFIWIECEAILREPAVDGTEAFVQPRYSIAVPQLYVELCIVRILGVMDPERWYDTGDWCNVGGEKHRPEDGTLRNAELARDSRRPIASDTNLLGSTLQIWLEPE